LNVRAGKVEEMVRRKRMDSTWFDDSTRRLWEREMIKTGALRRLAYKVSYE
jgi:hypothetical protein